MTFPPLTYIAWAKRTHDIERPRFNLGKSGIEPPGGDALGPLAGVPIHGDNPYGHPGLRALLARIYEVDEERVLCSAPGATGANFLVIAASLAPGETALVEAPGYQPLALTCEAVGARVEPLERAGGGLDLDRAGAAFRRGARLLVLTNIANPTGALLRRETILEAAALAERHGARVLVDEVYLEGAVDEAAARSAAAGGGSEALIVTSSLTKIYGLGALRAGFAIAPAAIVRRAHEILEHTGEPGPFVADELAIRALERRDAFRARALARIRENLPIVTAWAAARGDVTLRPPAGGFVAWVGLPPGVSSAAIEEPLRRAETAVAPGRFFGADDHIRIGFGVARTVLEEGLSRLSEVLDRARRTLPGR
jgi:hypothetical protein